MLLFLVTVVLVVGVHTLKLMEVQTFVVVICFILEMRSGERMLIVSMDHCGII